MAMVRKVFAKNDQIATLFKVSGQKHKSRAMRIISQNNNNNNNSHY